MDANLAIALTDHGAIVATDSNYLRFFSNSGIQTGIKCLDGPIVTMSGFGDFLFVVYHAGTPFISESLDAVTSSWSRGLTHSIKIEDQRLGYQLYDLSLGRRIADKLLLLSSAAELAWIGFSEAGVRIGDGNKSLWRSCDFNYE